MVARVRRESRMASAATRRSPRTRVRSPASIAASVPVPMASPRSAVARAAASLTPSPTMATVRPSPCSRRTTSTLSSGSTSAITSSMPTARATASATVRLSPVSSTGVSPRARSSRTASALVSLAASATARTPRARPSQPTVTAVRPSCSARRRASANSSGSASYNRPTATSRPSTRPRTPRPGTFSKCSAPGSAPVRFSAPAAIARATGCSEACSRAPASRSTSCSSSPSAAYTSWRVIRPLVTVPVLSSTTVSTRRVDSSTSGPLIRMPSWAPRPVPTISAVGVARPSAQGQAMIRTATAAVNAATVSPVTASQTPKVATATRMTTGTKTAEIRSARRCTSALPFCASSTSFAMRASCVSAPIRLASTTSRPPALTVAPVTRSPGPTSTGTDSPVSMAASTAETPSTTVPSVAIFSPGRTTNRSPTARADTGTRSSPPLRSTATSLAPSSISARRAAPARRLERASR